MLGPSTIEFCPLFFRQRELVLALRVGKALPKSHRKFSPIAGREFQELGKRAGFHTEILSRDVPYRNWFSPGLSVPITGATLVVDGGYTL